MRLRFLTGIALAAVLGADPALAADADQRLSVAASGAGPDVVLIPGLASSAQVWAPTAKALAGRYRVHVVQIAGFAGTPPGANEDGTVLAPAVEALHAYIQANKLASPTVIGHSLGGLIGLMLARAHPEDVGRLMIVDSLAFYSVLVGCRDVNAATPVAAAMRDKILGESLSEYAAGELQVVPELVKSPAGRTAVLGWADASDKAVVAQAMYDDMTTDLRPALASIRTPVTVIYPWDASERYSQAQVDAVYQASYADLPNKTLARIDGSYHFVMLDQPDAFAGRVETFLRSF